MRTLVSVHICLNIVRLPFLKIPLLLFQLFLLFLRQKIIYIYIIPTCSFSFPYRTEVVVRYSAEKCRRLGRILIRQSSGLIGNVDDVTWHPPCAYVIEVPLGQRINVTLLDFAYWSTNQSSARCEELAVIKEGKTGKNAIACRDGVRDKVVFLSHSNIIEVVLLACHPSRRFLLHYEGEYTCLMYVSDIYIYDDN